MTFALGWALSKSGVVLEHLIADLLPGTWSDVTEAVIDFLTGPGETATPHLDHVSNHLLMIIETNKSS